MLPQNGRPLSQFVAIATISLLAMAACNQQSIVASRYLTSKAIEANAGGTITVTAAQSASYSGTSIVIPPGALPADTTITIAASDDTIRPDGTDYGPVVVLGPGNIVFQRPVTVKIPVLIAGSPSALQVGFIAASGASGNLQATVAPVADRLPRQDKVPEQPLPNGYASFTVDQLGEFGSYYADDISTCAAACPADCADPELCYSDGKTYCNTCVGACSGATQVSCTDGGSGACTTDADCAPGVNCIEGLCSPVGECLAGCGLSCDLPGAVCYEDGNDYCSPCVALCLNVVTVPCGDGGVDGGTACAVDTDCTPGMECVFSCDSSGNCSSTCQPDAIDGGSFDGGSGDLDGGSGNLLDGGSGGEIDGGGFDGGSGASDGGAFDAGSGGCDSAGDCPFGQTCVEGVCNYDQDGGSVGGTNSVTGMVSGVGISSVGSSVGMNVSFGAGGECAGSANELIVMLSNSAGICAAVQSGNGLPDSAVLSLAFENPVGQPIVPGVYSFSDVDSSNAGAEFTSSDASCNLVVDVPAGGTIRLSSLNGGNAVGTFNLIFSTGDQLTGSFDTTGCLVGPSGPCAASGSTQCAGN